jgi:NAD(P)H-hydrate epimerase
MVVDADGLTALSPMQTPLRSQGSDDIPLILTPHEGEFRKLLGVDKDRADEIVRDRVAAVRDFATGHNVILVLKGERVLIGAPDGRVIVNPTGNSGLGKAGNGDTLTGILIGFVAQAVQMKIDMLETVVAACYVAGMAGDIAERKYGKRVMTASDVRECLVDVFAELTETIR